MKPFQILHALYELQIVKEHFGGKYSNMILVTTSELPENYKIRANEMGIELRVM